MDFTNTYQSMYYFISNKLNVHLPESLYKVLEQELFSWSLEKKYQPLYDLHPETEQYYRVFHIDILESYFEEHFLESMF